MKKFIPLLIALAGVAAGIPALPTLPKDPVVRSVVMSPKLAGQAALAGATMFKCTNVFKLAFTWRYDFDDNVIDTFALHWGTNSVDYPNEVLTGLSTNYIFAQTNWNERGLRHFFVATAIRVTEESDNSPFTFWPPLPPDHISLSWDVQPWLVTVYESHTIPPVWSVVADMVDDPKWSTNIVDGNHFFKIDPPAPLRIRLFNPGNDVLGPPWMEMH